MNIKTYWRNMDIEGRQAFAVRAKTTTAYIERHLIQEPPTRQPRPDLLKRLAVASEGHLSRFDLYEHFYNYDPANASPKSPRGRPKKIITDNEVTA